MDAAQQFEPHRRHLTGLAYRMLGSVADAQDMVQDAYLRWQATARDGVGDARAFLSRTVARLCLDHLRSARHRREVYVGPWLPEPLLDHPDLMGGDPQDDVAGGVADDLSVTLLLALERLSPLERAAFLLHDVFGQDFSELARTLERTPEACRQLAVRARRHVQQERPRFPLERDAGERLAREFQQACLTGDAGALGRMLAADAVLYSDGGGKAYAALNPIVGAARIARMFGGLSRKGMRMPVLHIAWINGMPGCVLTLDGTVIQTTALDVADGHIRTVYIVRNPDKLQHVPLPPGSRA